MTTRIVTIAQSRALEQAADQAGIGFAQLMENAGRATARAIETRITVREKRVLVLIGPGNNGGDGLVAAHYLSEAGARVTCYVWRRDVPDDANFRRVENDGLPVAWEQDDRSQQTLLSLVEAADVVVDSLLGVGVSRPIEGALAGLLAVVRGELSRPAALAGLDDTAPRRIGRVRPLVVAVDCPTGLDCDTGALDPAALCADVTVTFAHPKVGLLRFPGAEAVGALIVADIGIPTAPAGDAFLEMATSRLVRSWLPQRPRSAHKGSFGRALIVAGSANYTGAAALAGAAATRVGTGLVTVGLPMSIHQAVSAQLTEATYLLLPHDLGVIASGAVELVRERAGEYDALLVGPGLTQVPETVAFVQALLGQDYGERRSRIGFVASAVSLNDERPVLPALVVDADALNALARAERWWDALPSNTILTPHPGEMARLMGEPASAASIQADREAVCRKMASAWGTVVVLKGAFTVVADPGGRTMVLPFANAGLATAGSGDVLGGAIVGLRAQGMGAFEAAVAGAYLHGLAGELVRDELGDMGMVAGDLLRRLPLALLSIRQARTETEWDNGVDR